MKNWFKNLNLKNTALLFHTKVHCMISKTCAVCSSSVPEDIGDTSKEKVGVILVGHGQPDDRD